MICDSCRREGLILEFAFVPYPIPGDPPGLDYSSTLKCPDCGSESISELTNQAEL